MHIFRDLQPYICTFGDCSESLTVFPTRKMWFEHELTKHRAESLLECHECLRRFDTESDFLVHHEMDHSRHFSKLHLQASLSSAKNYLPLVPEELQCPLCLQGQWTSQRKFVTHLGRHMEDIALASLPRDAASASEAGSDPESDADSQISERSGDLYPSVPTPRNPSPTQSTSPRGKRIKNLSRALQVLEQVEETSINSVEDGDAPRVRRTNQIAVRMPKAKKLRLQRSIDQDKDRPNARKEFTQSESVRRTKNSQRRVFTCPFSNYGCESTFGSKGEWKRHTSTQHLQLGFYRCDTGQCDPDRQESPMKPTIKATVKSYNDFNRKDLFTQHHRRMHTPWDLSKEPSAKVRLEFEESLENVRRRCWRERRAPPQRSTCGFCGRVFEGPDIWDERMEHVGKHFEGRHVDDFDVENMVEEEDEDLRNWAIKEGIVKDCRSRGFWLEGMEPPDVPGSIERSRRRGRGRVEVEEE